MISHPSSIQVNTNLALPARTLTKTPQELADNTTTLATSNAFVTIPFALTLNSQTLNPATVTEEAIFYAVNPYYQVYEGLMRWCSHPEELGKLQLSVTSSFAGITLWRVYPYIYCRPSQTNGCYEGLSSGVVIPGTVQPTFDMDACNKTSNFIVTGMDYIDTENIAVSVLRSTLTLMDSKTMRPINPDDGVSRTVTYFLNTVTMQIREGVAWQSEVHPSLYSFQLFF